MQGFIAGTTFALFICLSVYSWHHQIPIKQVVIWRDKKSETIASIYDISPSELENAANIFGKE